MKYKKIRGHKRIWKQIEAWRQENINIDLIDYVTMFGERHYVKVRIHPWSGITLTNSIAPEPNGETRRRILNALLDIYTAWKKQLDSLDQPYYLKIRLFEPRFSQSQVVCAIGANLAFYEQAFYTPIKTKAFNPVLYGPLKHRLEAFNWDYCLDEDSLYNDWVGSPNLYSSMEDYEDSKRWFVKRMKKPHRTEKIQERLGPITEFYYFKKGDVWIGSLA